MASPRPFFALVIVEHTCLCIFEFPHFVGALGYQVESGMAARGSQNAKHAKHVYCTRNKCGNLVPGLRKKGQTESLQARGQGLGCPASVWVIFRISRRPPSISRICHCRADMFSHFQFFVYCWSPGPPSRIKNGSSRSPTSAKKCKKTCFANNKCETNVQTCDETKAMNPFCGQEARASGAHHQF